MTGGSRLKWLARAGFLFVCVMVLGGMTWATWLTVRLEDFEMKASREETLQTALWRADNWFMPVLALESGRSYLQYNAFYNPPLLYTAQGEEEEPTSYLTMSPLYDQSARDWIDVYFQLAPREESGAAEDGTWTIRDGTWSSPQVAWKTASPLLRSGPNEARREELLSVLHAVGDSVSYEEVQTHLTMAQADPQDAGFELGYRKHPPQEQSAYASQARGLDKLQLTQEKAIEAWNQRQTMNRTVQQQSMPIEACDRADVIKGNLLNQQSVSDEAPDSSPTSYEWSVRVSGFYPMWFTLLTTGERKLMFVRRVTIGRVDDEQAIFQGFVVDWRRLSNALLRELADAYPGAAVRPEESTRRTRSHQMLATLPASLDIRAPLTGASLWVWNENRATLAVAWGAGLVALVLIGLGLRGLLAVSNRRVEFAYAVAHELRTPLTTFRLYTDMLAEGLVPEESRTEYLQTLNRESKRLADLVNGVLEYARVENRRVRLNPRSISAAEFLERARATFEKPCDDEGVQLVLENHWRDGEPLRTDVDLVLCVAGVLVANACRHGRNGKQSQVHLQLEHSGDRIHLDVVDNGPGIDARDNRTLYKPFRRGRSAEANARGGLGLGLALARNWSKLLGGRLDLVARRDVTFGGAHFRLTLPQLSGNGQA